MLRYYDDDGSGSLDTPPEVVKVHCLVWQAIDQSIAAEGTYSGVRATYGFPPGYIWVGSALGFDESMRAQADAALGRCDVGE